MQPNIIERVWRQDKMVNVDVLNGFVFTGEVGAHKFVISGKNVNTPVDISGTITANFKNADGVLVPLTGTIEDGKAVVVLSRECYAVEGPFSLMIFADTVCIYAAIANAINSSGEVIAYPTATIPSVQELIEEVQDVIASIPQDYSALNQSVTDLKSAFTFATKNLVENAIIKSGLYITAQGTLDTVGAPDRTICIEAESNKRYRIKKASSTLMRAGCASSPNAAVGTTLTSFVQYSSASNAELIVETGGTNRYIYIQLFAGSDTASYRTIAANVASMIVVEDIDDKIAGIEEDISHVVKKRTIKATDFTVTGYYGANGAFSQASGFGSTEKIDISGFSGGSITGECKGVNGNLACYTFFKADGAFLSCYMGTSPYDIESFSIDIPEAASYVAFSKHNAAKLAPTVIELNAVQYAKQAIIDSQPFEYFVGYGQNDKIHYFSNLVECLWDADSKPETNKVINIAQGTYDVLAGLGGMDHVNSYSIAGGDTATGEGVQPWLTNCKIIGWGKAVLNFILDDSAVRDHYWLFSCLNVRGNIEIENIEIHSKNCRYSIHDESGSNYKKTTRKYKNVKCYQNENGGQGGQAVGSGFSVDTTAEYEGCTFVSGTASPAWSCHSKGRSALLFKDNIFQVADGNNVALGISQEGSVYMYAMISDCFLTNKLLVRDEGGDTTVIGMTKIDLINTHVSGIECGYASTIQEPITLYNTITGEKTVLLSPTT